MFIIIMPVVNEVLEIRTALSDIKRINVMEQSPHAPNTTNSSTVPHNATPEAVWTTNKDLARASGDKQVPDGVADPKQSPGGVHNQTDEEVGKTGMFMTERSSGNQTDEDPREPVFSD